MDRYMVASRRGEEVVLLYERFRGAKITSVSAGRSPALSAALTSIGADPLPFGVPASADLVSVCGSDVRLIEIKARGGKGAVQLPLRQIETFRCARARSWLYVVWNTTQPHPVELWTVQDPIKLPWVGCGTAERPLGRARGVRHEDKYQVDHSQVEAAGIRVDLAPAVDGLAETPTWLGAARD